MIEILRANGGGFFWRVKAANGQTLCTSEVYVTKTGAQVGVDSLKKIMPFAMTYDRT